MIKPAVYLILILFSACKHSEHKNDVQLAETKDSVPLNSIQHVQQIDTSNQAIYDFMQRVILLKHLNLNYGLSLEPETRCDLSQDDSSFLKTLLIEEEEKKEKENGLITIYSMELKKCLSQNDIKDMLFQKEKLKNFNWDNARLGFNLGNSKNWYSFSVPLFSRDKKKVILMIRDLCPGLCGTGSTVLFTQEKGIWNVSETSQWVH